MIERSDGAVVGVEVKLSLTLSDRDTRGLADLAEAAGARFHRGVILYPGDTMVPFGPTLHAVPLARLRQW